MGLVEGYSLVACPCTLLLFGLSQRGQEYCCKVRYFDQMPTMFAGWNVEQGKGFAFFSKSKKQISWTQCAVDAVARIGLACSPLRGKKLIHRASWKWFRFRFGSVCGSCGSMAVSGSCGSVRGSRFGSRTFLTWSSDDHEPWKVWTVFGP